MDFIMPSILYAIGGLVYSASTIKDAYYYKKRKFITKIIYALWLCIVFIVTSIFWLPVALYLIINDILDPH